MDVAKFLSTCCDAAVRWGAFIRTWWRTYNASHSYEYFISAQSRWWHFVFVARPASLDVRHNLFLFLSTLVKKILEGRELQMAACHFDQIAALRHDFGLGLGGLDPSLDRFQILRQVASSSSSRFLSIAWLNFTSVFQFKTENAFREIYGTPSR